MYVRRGDPVEVDDDDGASGSYIYESESEVEAYEYESDDDLVDSIMEDDSLLLESSDEDDKPYKAWLEQFYTTVPGPFPPSRPASPVPILRNPASDLRTRDEENSDLVWCEHIAGPDCTIVAGYSGYRISLEEMKGCTSFQCLMEKRRDWQPIEDDEGFELESDFFLTGLGIDMPSRDENSPTVLPVRHGADLIEPEDWHIYAFGVRHILLLNRLY